MNWDDMSIDQRIEHDFMKQACDRRKRELKRNPTKWYHSKEDYFRGLGLQSEEYRREASDAFYANIAAARERMAKNRVDRDELVPVGKEETITIENK